MSMEQPPHHHPGPYGPSPVPPQPQGYGPPPAHRQPQPTYAPPVYRAPFPDGAGETVPHGALANSGARLAARILDAVFVAVPTASLAGLLWLVVYTTQEEMIAEWLGTTLLLTGIVLTALVLLGYEPFMIWKSGATFGKRICGLRVVRLGDGGTLSFGRAWLRWFMYVLIGAVPLLGLLNGLWCLWDEPYRQCLHDKAADSVVLSTREALPGPSARW